MAKTRFFATPARHLLSSATRHLLHSEIRLMREEGFAKALRYNSVLVDAWLRNRANRNRYRPVAQTDAASARKSDTVFVFGSGSSLNDITADEWQHIARHDVFGFNAFYYQRWVDVDFHLLRGGVYGELRWRGHAEAVTGEIAKSPHYRHAVFVMQEEFLAQFCNQLIGYRLLPPVRGVLRYRTNRQEGTLPSRNLSDGLRHVGGTLSDAVNCAYCLGWRHIVLTGVDLYDSRYFWLPPDKTATVDRATARILAADVNALRGTRSDDRHYTLQNGVIELMAEWRRHFAAEGVDLTVYNPGSLLAAVLPVYRPTAT